MEDLSHALAHIKILPRGKSKHGAALYTHEVSGLRRRVVLLHDKHLYSERTLSKLAEENLQRPAMKKSASRIINKGKSEGEKTTARGKEVAGQQKKRVMDPVNNTKTLLPLTL